VRGTRAGRDLAHWHLNYETVACHPGVAIEEAASAPPIRNAATTSPR
jgi:predicted helicase